MPALADGNGGGEVATLSVWLSKWLCFALCCLTSLPGQEAWAHPLTDSLHMLHPVVPSDASPAVPSSDAFM